MGNLLQLLLRIGGGLLFVLLEGICFYLIVSYNNAQQQVAISTANAFTGAVSERVSNMQAYLDLAEQIDQVKAENAELRAKLETSKYQSRLLIDSVFVDTVLQHFSFLPAQVVSKTLLGRDNTMTINRGRLSGITPHTGVISPNGVVGVVVAVSDHHARVMTTLHRQSRVSAALKSSNYHGSLTWDGDDARYMTLEAIPKHITVAIGDTIVTSGYSDLFPRGIQLGTVKDFKQPKGGNNYTIRIAPFADLMAIEHVYVVKSNFRADVDTLNTKSPK